MANPVVNFSVCTCSFGMTPCPLPVTSQQTVITSNMPQGTIMDNHPPTFGMCSSMANPTVAAATAAAFGRGAMGARRAYRSGMRQTVIE